LFQKDNWDDEEEEQASTASGTSAGGPKPEKKNKKRLIGKIAEKEVLHLKCLLFRSLMYCKL